MGRPSGTRSGPAACTNSRPRSRRSSPPAASAALLAKFLQSFAEGGQPTRDASTAYGWMMSWSAAPLFPTINVGAGTAELGVFLAKDARGQGIVTRTVEAMIDWALSVRGLRRLDWRCAPDNEPSRAIPRRLGFTHEGTLREVFRVREDFHDLEAWSLLRDEWRA